MTWTRPIRWILAVALAAAAAGCQTSRSDADTRGSLTAGMVKKSVIRGETTQTEVLEIFGPPDLLTHTAGAETWTYDKTTYDFETTSSYFTVVLAGAGKDTARSSSRSTMVIIYFDANEVVRDFRLSVVRY